MNFWHLVKVVRSRLLPILGLVGVTVLVIVVAIPKPKVVYPATAYVSPSAQVMQGGMSTATGGAQGVPAAVPIDRTVVLSNLIILAQGGEVYERAREFLALPVEEQRKLCTDLPFYKQIDRLEIAPGKLLDFREWGDVLEVAPVQMPSLGEKGTTTDILAITVKLREGELSPYVANAVGYAFSEVFQDKSREDIRKYEKFLDSSRNDVKAKLHDLQAKMAEYKTQHSVTEVSAETENAINQLAGVETTRSAAQADLSEAEAALSDVNAQLSREPVVVRDQLPSDMSAEVQKLKAELSQAEADLRMLAQRYTPQHETYKAAVARINDLKNRIKDQGASFAPPRMNEVRQELVKKRSDALYKVATARAKLSAINASYARAQGKITSLAQAEPGLNELVQEYTQEQSSYKMISERLAQAQVAEKEFTRTGSIIPYGWSRAVEREVVQGPTRKVLLLYGILLSLIAGIAAAIWFDSIDTRMRNAGDVEKLLELPAIGLTPKLTSGDGNLPKLTHVRPLSAMAESYRILRTNILFALRDTPFKTLMVATGRPGQGGTTTICNLAIALAQIGKRIILIDADMRRPSLHKFFSVSNETGLSTVLQGNCKLTDAFRKTDIENLVVIPGGPQPLNPSELLGSEHMREMVEMLQEHCDLVLFDTPSVIVFSDGPMLASWVDAVVMVVSANQAPRGTEVQTRDLLRRANANILGVVVNRMQPELVDSCYYYSHYYSDSIAAEGGMNALADGNGNNGASTPKVEAGAPKAISASGAQVTADSQDENPFPD